MVEGKYVVMKVSKTRERNYDCLFFLAIHFTKIKADAIISV